MTRHLTRLHTGPCEVDYWADKIEAAGYSVETRGTEAVYVWLPETSPGWGIIPALGELEQATGLTSHIRAYSVVVRSKTE